MKLYVVRDSNFTMNSGFPASNLLHYEAYASRYLQVFSEVVLVGRLFSTEDRSAKPVTGPGVRFHAFPGYQGPVGFLKSLGAITKAMFGTIEREAAYILRVPAAIPSVYAVLLWLRGVPFAVEVAADPFDTYSPHATSSAKLSIFWRWLFVSMVRWQCRKASATAYVTSDALQRRYPPGREEFSFSFTSLDLTDDCYREATTHTPKQYGVGPMHVVMIGNMQKSLKGHDTLLSAVARLVREGVDLRLTIVGFGESMPMYKDLAMSLQIADRVTFTGKLAAGKAVRDVLDTGDLFVLPSRQEGLPRALLEAMARGLPAIASDVGGTSELLPSHALTVPDDVEGLANRIRVFLSDADLRKRESDRNLEVARRYHIESVNAARIAFFEVVKNSVGERDNTTR